jgi:hypothetical protein
MAASVTIHDWRTTDANGGSEAPRRGASVTFPPLGETTDALAQAGGRGRPRQWQKQLAHDWRTTVTGRRGRS